MGVLVHVENGGELLLKNRNFMQPMKRHTRGLKKIIWISREGGGGFIIFCFPMGSQGDCIEFSERSLRHSQ